MPKADGAGAPPGRLRRALRGFFARPPEADARPDAAAVPARNEPAGDGALALRNAGRWCRSEAPAVSIILAAPGDGAAERQALAGLWQATEGATYETLIVRGPGIAEPALRAGRGTRVLAVAGKRHRGEAWNIAAEQAAGRLLCFLDERAAPRAGWLAALLAAYAGDPRRGAAVVARLPWPPAESGPSGGGSGGPEDAGLVPATALLVDRALFLDLGGFDLMFEPSAYEDWDLCLRIRAAGRGVATVDGTVLFGPAPEPRGRRQVIDLNRAKLAARWGAALDPANRRAPPAPGPVPASVRGGTRRALIYTPYDLTPGGGERYLLTLAVTLRATHDVTIVTPAPYSRLRLRQLGEAFGLDLAGIGLADQSALGGPTADLAFSVGNSIVPPVPARAAASWFICQFPYPAKDGAPAGARERLAGYTGVIVYSDYAKGYVAAAAAGLGLAPPVAVLPPPVPPLAGDATRKRPMILNVGRFFVGANAKGQDRMIAVFRDIAGRFGEPVELHFAGSAAPSRMHMEYLFGLEAAAKDLPVRFHVNPDLDLLAGLFRDAALYWHATGIDADREANPGSAEHFGITIVEAMSAECVPLALDWGGPREIIDSGRDGYLYASAGELGALSVELMGDAPRRIALGRAAGISARRYAVDRFAARLGTILAGAGYVL